MEQKVKLNSGTEITVPEEVMVVISGDAEKTSGFYHLSRKQLGYALHSVIHTMLLAEYEPEDVIEMATKSIVMNLERQSITPTTGIVTKS